MFFLPRAEFWRLWAAALALALAASLAFAAIDRAHAQTMRASFYDQGTVTASGRAFNPWGFTAAHRWLPFGTRLRACFVDRCVTVVVTDRGPFVRGRSLDLSRGAARAIGLEHRGVAAITVTRLD